MSLRVGLVDSPAKTGWDFRRGKLLGKPWLNNWLVVWNMNFMTFHSVGNVIIPTDELIFFRGVETTNQTSLISDCLFLATHGCVFQFKQAETSFDKSPITQCL